MSEEDKIKKREYAKNRYHNMSGEKKQKLKAHQKNIYQESKESKHNKSVPICSCHADIFVVTILYKIICAFVLGIILKYFFIKKTSKIKKCVP